MEAIATATVIIIAFLASTPTVESEPWWNVLIQGGIGGIVIGWFMWRDKQERENREVERRAVNAIQSENTKALNLMTRALMVQVIAIKHVDETARELAAKIKEEADAAIGSIK